MVTIKDFDACPLGDVKAITLSNSHMSATLLTYGATLQSLTLPDKNGTPTDVALGFDTMAGYLATTTYVGATIGRCANRIGNSEFSMNGKCYTLTANEGENQLHGGPNGFDKALWDYHHTQDSVTFTYTSPHGEEGYPGNLKVAVTYALSAPTTLTMDYHAIGDKNTLCSLTAHGYFNLDGQGNGTVANHLVTLRTPSYTPADAQNIPTGEVVPVAGTSMDFSQPTPISYIISLPQLAHTRGLDHNFMLPPADGQPVATLSSPKSGISMVVTTTLPALQVYTAGFFPPQEGKGGTAYDSWHGVAMEPQYPPDAIHQPHFPSPILPAGQVYSHQISYTFDHQ